MNVKKMLRNWLRSDLSGNDVEVKESTPRPPAPDELMELAKQAIAMRVEELDEQAGSTVLQPMNGFYDISDAITDGAFDHTQMRELQGMIEVHRAAQAQRDTRVKIMRILTKANEPDAAGKIAFHTQGVERYRIDASGQLTHSAGNVGIGQTTAIVFTSDGRVANPHTSM